MEFRTGGSQGKLGYLKKMDRLSGFLKLIMKLEGAEDLVEAKKAELRNKKHLRVWEMYFEDFMSGSNDDDELRSEILEALHPPPYLQSLLISGYGGTKCPGWINTSLNHLRSLELDEFDTGSSLPPLGKLPCLEELSVSGMGRFLDREFLGTTVAGEVQKGVIGGFPKLQKLSFYDCYSWKEWEDITEEEAANDNLNIMPCLKDWTIMLCPELSALPHRLLCKASALESLIIQQSFHLWEYYDYKDGSGWGSLSHVPHLTVARFWCNSTWCEEQMFNMKTNNIPLNI